MLCRGLVLAVVISLAAAQAENMAIYINNGEGKPASLTMGQGLKKIRFVASDQVLDVSTTNGTVFSLSPNAASSSSFNEEIVGIVDMLGDLSVRDIYAEDIEMLSPENQLQNWLIAGNADDTFTNSSSGWASASGKPIEVQKCAGIHILGGPNQLAGDSVVKVYTLPQHAEVQVTARVSFIDNWDDDTAWMKLDGEVMWTEEYNWCAQFFTMMCAKGHNACGKPEYPDRLSRLISVSMPHTGPTLTVEFGTTIPVSVPSSEVSLGISSVTVEVR